MNKNSIEIATLAGGCFWTIEAVYALLNGVTDTVTGYCGGHTASPTYEEVLTGATGHVETVQITFNPEIISYKQLLDIFWYIHNPTTRNRQYPDSGSQYNSIIFYHNERQKMIAEESKGIVENLDKSPDRMRMEIVTQIIPASPFYPAEERHQHFCQKNPHSEYCQNVTRRKIETVRAVFPQYVK